MLQVSACWRKGLDRFINKVYELTKLSSIALLIVRSLTGPYIGKTASPSLQWNHGSPTGSPKDDIQVSSTKALHINFLARTSTSGGTFRLSTCSTYQRMKDWNMRRKWRSCLQVFKYPTPSPHPQCSVLIEI